MSPPASPIRNRGTCATLACLWEATAAKPGNVHRGADFEDMRYTDFLLSATIIAPIIDQCESLGLGGTVLAAVEATRGAVGINTNLGTLLLLAPLALARADVGRAGMLVEQASEEDVAKVYEAIRLATPGGLGQVASGDVAAPPQHSLRDAMQLAADRDLVARQYTNNFAEVAAAADTMGGHLDAGCSLNDSIVLCQLLLLSRHGDSLVARKLGNAASQQLATQAGQVLSFRSLDPAAYRRGLADLDFWTRADGHRRNPGTTADLIAAGLFLLLMQRRVEFPVRFY